MEEVNPENQKYFIKLEALLTLESLISTSHKSNNLFILYLVPFIKLLIH